MSAINFHTKEISVKIVYYGPGLCGKTTTLQTIYGKLPEKERPQLVSLATDVDRTIFFDFLPVTAYRIRDFKVRLQLYTVPGQVFYNATRKLVLNGVDGVVFVADSQRAMHDSNAESLQNLEENLSEIGLDIAELPLVMQFNKRDLTDLESLDDMDRHYNKWRVPVFATVATTGEGIFDALKAISQKVVNDLIRKGLGQKLRAQEEAAKRAATTSEQAGDGYSTVEEAMAQAVRGSLWPSGQAARLGNEVAKAIDDSNWAETVLAIERLLDHEVRKWAADQGRTPSDALATFLFLRGAPVARYRAYLQDLVAARAGKTLSQQAAANAFILALEAVW